MKLADALVTTLRDWGIDYLFGVGGANIEHLFDAVHRLGDNRLQSVFAKSEVGAAFMADCRARVHRTLGVCCSTSGGGMMNLAVGIAEAFAESAPVLAIVGQPPTNLEGRGAFQDSSGKGRSVDADRLWGAITKFRAKITDANQFWTCLESAVRAALSDRPGPAVLMIPRDLYDQEVGPRPASLPDRLEDLVNVRAASPSEIAELFDRIYAAKSPVMILGSGVDRSANPYAVVEFARRMGVQVVTTTANKASFPNDDPLFLGTAGVAGEPSVHEALRDRADLIVAVGTGLNVMTRSPLADALKPEQLAVVNIDKSEVLGFVRPALLIEADAGLVFAELSELCELRQVVPKRPKKPPVKHYSAQLAPELPALGCDDVTEEFRRPDELLQSSALREIQRILPPSGHIVFDAGNCAVAAMHYLQIPRNATSTIALGMGGMGYSIAAAVGAQLGSPAGSRTVVFCGDGAFLMLGMEIHTAVHYQLPVLYIVFNNAMHGMCVTRQQIYFDGRIECSRYPPFSVAGVARGLGRRDRLWVGSAESTCELAACLDDYESHSNLPGVLELKLTREQIPPFVPFLPQNANTFVVAPTHATASF
ncbi:thiamine pyrophosphate-binding protein [Pirellulales bacterium]|nr:thiamine pyrophosphate-binding protein [Pirellulales bacterium]